MNHSEPDKASKVSSIHGSGLLSLRVNEFNFLKSKQNLTEPSFLLAMTMGEHQGLVDGSIILSLAIF